MASAIEHWRAAEHYAALAKVNFDDEDRAAQMRFAEFHKEMAKIGVMALNDADTGKTASEIFAWIQEVGHHEPPSKGPVAMGKAA